MAKVPQIIGTNHYENHIIRKMPLKLEHIRPKDIKSCPFCGCQPETIKYRHHGWGIGCKNRDCQFQPSSYYFKTEDDAIQVWNKR